MKKTLAMLMALLMALCLAACGAGGGTDQSAGAPNTGTSAPAEGTDASGAYVVDAAGNTSDQLAGKTITFLNMNLDTETRVAECETMAAILESYGATCEILSAESSLATYTEQIENCTTMGVDAIAVIPDDPVAVQDAILRYVESGGKVIFQGVYPDYHDQVNGCTMSFPSVGEVMAAMAIAWVDQSPYAQAETGGIHVAVMRKDAAMPHQLISNAYEEGLAADGRFTIASTHSDIDGISNGYDAAEEALTSDPEIRIFLCNTETAAQGTANYIESRSDLNVDDFAIFCFGTSTTTAEYIDRAGQGDGCLRGTVTNGTYTGASWELPGVAGAAQVIRMCLTGELEPGFWFFDDVWTINSFGYEAMLDEEGNNTLLDIYNEEYQPPELSL